MIEYFVVLSLAPVLGIMAFIYLVDKYEPEPKHLVLKVLFMGALFAIPAAIIELPISKFLFYKDITPWALFSNIFWGIAVIEELAKIAVVFLFIYKTAEFDEVNDGIVYACAASLGFAGLEHILYMIKGSLSAGMLGMTFVGVLRSMTAVPAHACFGVAMGYFLGKSKFQNPFMKKVLIFVGFLTAVLMHTVYNFFALTNRLDFTFTFLFVMILFCALLQIRALRESRHKLNPQKEDGPPLGVEDISSVEEVISVDPKLVRLEEIPPVHSDEIDGNTPSSPIESEQTPFELGDSRVNEDPPIITKELEEALLTLGDGNEGSISQSSVRALEDALFPLDEIDGSDYTRTQEALETPQPARSPFGAKVNRSESLDCARGTESAPTSKSLFGDRAKRS